MSAGTALEIRLRMPVAQFRNPLTFDYAQTYPLPPPSTVIGMVQSQLGEFGLGPRLAVSVKGIHRAVAFNYVRLVKGYLLMTGAGIINEFDEGKSAPLIASQRSPTYQQELHGLRLIIHLGGDPELLARIRDALAAPRNVIALGRGEDVAFLEEEPRMVPVYSRDVGGVNTVKYGTYVPADAEYLANSSVNRHPQYLILDPEYELEDGGRAYSIYAQRGLQRPGLRGTRRVLYVEPGGSLELRLDGPRVDFADCTEDPLFWFRGAPG
ncbi:MAG: CRISPR-associated protein Cas5 [Anaerolineae bacterium]